MLDFIIDLCILCILLIVWNVFGGVYVVFNSYVMGVDVVLVLLIICFVVMGNVGKEFVYKKEMQVVCGVVKGKLVQCIDELMVVGGSEVVVKLQV